MASTSPPSNNALAVNCQPSAASAAAVDDEDEAASDFDVKELDRFDYFRFTMADLNGIARCVSLPRRHVDEYLQHGLGFYAGFLGVTVTSDPVRFDEIDSVRYGNALLKPMKGTLRSLPWATRGKYRVGEFLCEMNWMPPFRDGGPQEACPRYVARRQLDRLASLGYRLYSAFEAEFTVLHRADHKPIFGGPLHSEVCTGQLLADIEEFLYDTEQMLARGGIDISKLHTEYGPGQLELVPQPGYGIESADTMFRMREALKEMCRLRDWEATFMGQPFPDWPPTGLHFNHSLWSTSESQKNAMYDEDDPDRLSDVARWWVAGLLKHCNSLMALCCPTVNCYRRLGGSFAPTIVDWAIDDRHATFRVKNYGPKETYVENRMPSGPANPYLVLAATVAAGIDGIVNRLSCPPQRVDGQGAPLVTSLAKALDVLEADRTMKEALGEEFIRWFVQSKREGEVNKLSDSSSIADERKLYIGNL
jgi:glutamine synthetase